MKKLLFLLPLFVFNKGRMKFVGVYNDYQNYDFGETKKYIEENNLKNRLRNLVKSDVQSFFVKPDLFGFGRSNQT